jgi:oligopeptide transport system substrate-binding protein
MTDPTRPQRPPANRPPDVPVPADPERPGDPGHPGNIEDGQPRSWTRNAIFGTALLIIVMVAAGLFAAIMVTPEPDEDALVRPESADLVVAGGAPLSWDPAIISDAVSAQLLSQVFEGLTVLDAASEVRPALAESWSVEDDGQRIVFELREGLTFSDGTPIDAEDVRRSWLRVIDPARPSPLSSLLDDVAGAAAYARGEGGAEAVGLHADGTTLSVDFERPASYFPAVAAVPSLAVVPEGFGESRARLAPGESFVASGPYVPEEGEPGEVRLQANDAYWSGTPDIDSITVLTDDGGRSRVDVFEDEAVDWTRISPADASWIRYDRRLGPQLRHTEEMSVEFMGFDTSQPPFDDPAARRAVAMAVDWRRLARLDDPEAEAPSSLVPPGIASGGSDDYLLSYDPDAARAELSAAGYPGGAGFPVVSLVTYGVGRVDAIAADLQRELGIEVAVERRPFGEHSVLLDRDTPAMWTLAWSADYPHAHDFLGLLLRSDSSANVGEWSDAEYDALIDAAASTGDPAEQAQLYGEAQTILRGQVPLIPMAYGSSWALSREGLRGATISGVGQLRYADLAWAD